MAWEIKTLGRIDANGRFSIDNLHNLEQYRAELKLHKEEICRLVLSPYNPKQEEEDQRSLRQNKYYHKCLDLICETTGDNHLELHEKLKVELLGRPYVLKDREVIVVPSTKDLTTKTFGEYLEKVFKFAAEMGIVLPTPNYV